MTKKVTSLSDLAKLTLGRNVDVAAQISDMPEVRTVSDIIKTARDGLQIIVDDSPTPVADGMSIKAAIGTAVHDAYALGQQNAKAEASMLHNAMASTYEKRAEFVVPAAVAGIMEQCGMTDLSLNFNELATVFERCKITVEVPDDLNVRYTLTHLADKPQQP